MAELTDYEGVINIYESPYRILKLLEEISDIFLERQIFIGRELTKKFESYYSGTAKELLAKKDKIKLKGEYSILINNFSEVS